MRSRVGAAGAALIIVSIPLAIAAGVLVGQELGELLLHFGIGAGFLVFAAGMTAFGVNRAVTVVGAVAAAVFGATFVLQGVASLLDNAALTTLAFDVLGHQLERVLPVVVLAWFAALLLTGSSGRSRILGWAIVPAVIGLEVATAIGMLIGVDIPSLKIHLFLPFVWVLFEAVEPVDGAERPARGRHPVEAVSAA